LRSHQVNEKNLNALLKKLSTTIPTIVILSNILKWTINSILKISSRILTPFKSRTNLPTYIYEFIGRIERNNRTTQDKLSCALAISASKNKKLWLYALSDAISKLNVVPLKHLNWETPYFQWFGIPYDFSSKPLMVVMLWLIHL